MEEPVEDAAAEPASEPATEPASEPAPDDNSAGGEPTGGGEEELGAWIRRAAAAAIRAAAPRAAAAAAPGPARRPDLQVIQGSGGGGGGGGGGIRDPIVTLLRWVRMSVVNALTEAQTNRNLDAAAAELATARRSAAEGMRLQGGANYFEPLARNIAHAHSKLMTRTPLLNDTVLKQYVDVVRGLLNRIDQLILARQQQPT